jgi:transcriptional regulator with XRE-family HTH domain
MFVYRSLENAKRIDDTLAVRYKWGVKSLQGTFYRALGERVRRARESARLSQGRLADFVGLSRSSIANIEAGRQPIYVDALVRVARQLETPVSKLIPSADKEVDAIDNEYLGRLPDDERRFVNLILRRSTPARKEKDGSEILPGKKASGRTSKTSSRQKGPNTS